MLSGLSLAVFLLLATSSARASGGACLCSALLPPGLRVNCSSLNLAEVPRLPSGTAELHVQNNRLTSVPPGLFDGLPGLKRVSLSGNPFHCDCGIEYLRNWLLRNRAAVSGEPTCASPGPVAQRAVADLSDDFFSPCGPARCSSGARDAALGVLLCCVIVLLLWGLRLAKTSAFTLRIDDRHSGLEVRSSRSLGPARARGPHAAPSSEFGSRGRAHDRGSLPQVLGAIQKKLNVKVKAT